MKHSGGVRVKTTGSAVLVLTVGGRVRRARPSYSQDRAARRVKGIMSRQLVYSLLGCLTLGHGKDRKVKV